MRVKTWLTFRWAFSSITGRKLEGFKDKERVVSSEFRAWFWTFVAIDFRLLKQISGNLQGLGEFLSGK